MDLYEDLRAKTEELEATIKDLRTYGRRLAEAERSYKTQLAKTCLRMKADGYAIGLIDKVCYGEDEVANARFERDLAQVWYDSTKELIQSLKLQIRVIEGQIQREWR